jgi:hypothetical protein
MRGSVDASPRHNFSGRWYSYFGKRAKVFADVAVAAYVKPIGRCSKSIGRHSRGDLPFVGTLIFVLENPRKFVE